MKIGTDAVDLNHNPILADIRAIVIMTPTEAIAGHAIGKTDAITEAVHDAHTPPLTHIILAMTLHITDHLDIEALQLTPGITTDHTPEQPTNPPRRPCTDLHCIPANYRVKHIPRGIQKLQ